jgi:hypothetical protein
MFACFKKLSLGNAPAAPEQSPVGEASWPAMQVEFLTVTVFLVEPNQAAENGRRLQLDPANRNKPWTVHKAIAYAQAQLQNPVVPLSRLGRADTARSVLASYSRHDTRFTMRVDDVASNIRHALSAGRGRSSTALTPCLVESGSR